MSVVIIIKSNIYMAVLMVEFNFLSVRIDIRNGEVDESTERLFETRPSIIQNYR
jgi:hypothetical protein